MENANADVIKQLVNLYVIKANYKYIQQWKKTDYKTNKKYWTWSTKIPGQGASILNDYFIQNHLDGHETLGVFSGMIYSKFVCFDVDFKEPQMAKWITYKICDTLRKVGIDEYYISFSGSKGYHVEIFIDDLIDIINSRKFYTYIINRSGVNQYLEQGEVEFRPSDTQGVKIPLGIQHKTGRFCGFCLEENSLKVMSKEKSQEYLFSIKKIKRKKILNVLMLDEEISNYNNLEQKTKSLKKEIVKTETSLLKHKDLAIYNEDVETKENKAIYLIENGLQRTGSRHNSLLLIAMFYNTCGETKEQIEQDLITWMKAQDKRMYNTPIEECLKDIKLIVDYVYDKNIFIKQLNKDVSIDKNELDTIITECKTKGEKQLSYAMLIHAKRFAKKNGEFYMTLSQMAETTGMTDRNAQRVIAKLEENNLIKVTQRNEKQKGTYIKVPNKYIVCFANCTSNATNITYLSDIKEKFDVDFSDCLTKLYSKKELNSLLPRRQRESLLVS